MSSRGSRLVSYNSTALQNMKNVKWGRMSCAPKRSLNGSVTICTRWNLHPQWAGKKFVIYIYVCVNWSYGQTFCWSSNAVNAVAEDVILVIRIRCKCIGSFIGLLKRKSVEQMQPKVKPLLDNAYRTRSSLCIERCVLRPIECLHGM